MSSVIFYQCSEGAVSLIGNLQNLMMAEWPKDILADA
jgi:hypothetical protein